MGALFRGKGSFNFTAPLAMGERREAFFEVKVIRAKSEITLPLMPAKPKSVRFDDMDGVLAEVKEVAW